ncbi:hypothetical protein PENCOP_c008G08585 [Penicillium coprophilum]|uniref:Uncharacterized protein n=1 Tax=Penicillium coprophilum TaxID=36646 RepID=A0A1V6UJ15_9EURO|nr:hypothetical protein PENCOP_c008G08585 [Penicillium coprophilum]
MSTGHLEILSQLRARASNRAGAQAAMIHEATLVMGVSARLIFLYAEECPQRSSEILRLLVTLERHFTVEKSYNLIATKFNTQSKQFPTIAQCNR